METKEYIEQIDDALYMLEKIRKQLTDIILDIADKEDLKKCQACDHYVPEDYIVDFYGEDICLDCRGNGYGE